MNSLVTRLAFIAVIALGLFSCERHTHEETKVLHSHGHADHGHGDSHHGDKDHHGDKKHHAEKHPAKDAKAKVEKAKPKVKEEPRDLGL